MTSTRLISWRQTIVAVMAIWSSYDAISAMAGELARTGPGDEDRRLARLVSQGREGTEEGKDCMKTKLKTHVKAARKALRAINRELRACGLNWRLCVSAQKGK